MKIKEGKVLFVDDDEDVLHTAKLILKPIFKKVTTLSNPDQLIAQIKADDYDVVVLDMNFKAGNTSGKEGLFWLKKLMEFDPEIHVLMNTAYGDISLAVEAMKLGAIDFMVKPWEVQKLSASVLNVYKLSRSRKEIKNLKSETKILADDANQQFDEFIGKAKSMQPVFETISKVAATDANVLILGENGTGKELVARMIHKASLRNSKSFINVDLGSITESLFESELFGHVKGAFTDAHEDRMGRFEVATGGSLFLDEIGNLSLPLQAKLLTVIQNRILYKIGSNKPVNFDVRLICATNKPIYQMVASDDFRQDLLYRINTVEINLPPLRQRIEDIPILVKHFHDSFKFKYGKQNQLVSDSAIKKLQLYHWPGNIRELQHVVERAVIMSSSDDLTASSFLLKSESELNYELEENSSMEDIEIKAIKNALVQTKGNLSNAAEALKIGRSTLYRKMKKYGI
jgi:two-component system, NtrC family, response regulator HydG